MPLISEVENSRKGYRNRLEIIRDILLAAGNSGSRKTHIMYKANLSYRLLKNYLGCVSESGLVECDEEACYTITDKGEMFLELYEDYEKDRREVEKQLNSLKNGREALEEMLISSGSG